MYMYSAITVPYFQNFNHKELSSEIMSSRK